MAKFSASVFITAKSNLDKVTKKAAKDFDKLNKKADAANSAFANFSAKSAGAVKSLAVFSAATIGAGLAVFKLAQNTADLGDDLAKTSQKVGIGVKDLQRLRHSAELGGASIKEFDVGLKVFSRAVDEAGSGVAEYQENFDRLGISLQDSNGNMKDSEDLLLEVADVFKNLEDGAAKASIAQQIFGRSGLSLIPMLNQGSEAIKNQGDWLEEHARLLTEDEAKASEAFNDRLLDLKKSLSNLTVPIATKLIPKITELAIKLTDVFSNIEKYMPAIKKFGVAAIATGTALAAFFGPIILFNKAKALFTLVQALGAVIKATWAFNAAALASPFVWIPAAIIAIGAGIYLLVKHWDTIKAAVVGFGHAAMGVIRGIIDFWADKFEPIFTSGALMTGLKAIGRAIFDFMLIPLRNVLKIAEKIPGVGKLAGGVNEKIDTLRESLFGDSSQAITAPQALDTGVIEAAQTNVSTSQKLDVNMRIDQDGRATVEKAKSDKPISFNSEIGLMSPMGVF